MVVGENPGSKFEKAQKLGLKILSEDEFLEMIKGGDNEEDQESGGIIQPTLPLG